MFEPFIKDTDDYISVHESVYLHNLHPFSYPNNTSDTFLAMFVA